MIARGLLALFAVLLALAPAPAAGQARDCELVYARKAKSVPTATSEIWFISGPAEFVCSDSTVVRADSAVLINEVSLELIGRVFYADSARALDADRAVYYLRAGRLFAQGNVVLTDRQNNGSVIRSPSLTYERALPPDRPEPRTVVTGRPHATLYPRGKGEAAPDDTTARPFEVDADWMEIRGESRFSAMGRVEITRGETRSGANSATFDQAGELLVLTGEAWVEQEDLRLEGRTIEARLSGDQLHAVTALEQAHLEGTDLNVDAHSIHLAFEEGSLQRLVAVAGPPPAEPDSAAADRPRAVAVARELRLVADSIDALAPAQELREILAVGDAFAQRKPDSLSAGLPELIATDWVSGDTVNAFFAPAQAPADSGVAPATVAAAPLEPGRTTGPAQDSAEVVLERLVVIGNGGGAQALYRVSREGDEPGPPAINYTIADRIVLLLSEGEVTEAEATGEVRGRYLEPHRGSVGAQPAPASPRGQQPPGSESR